MPPEVESAKQMWLHQAGSPASISHAKRLNQKWPFLSRSFEFLYQPLKRHVFSRATTAARRARQSTATPANKLRPSILTNEEREMQGINRVAAMETSIADERWMYIE